EGRPSAYGCVERADVLQGRNLVRFDARGVLELAIELNGLEAERPADRVVVAFETAASARKPPTLWLAGTIHDGFHVAVGADDRRVGLGVVPLVAVPRPPIREAHEEPCLHQLAREEEALHQHRAEGQLPMT